MKNLFLKLYQPKAIAPAIAISFFRSGSLCFYKNDFLALHFFLLVIAYSIGFYCIILILDALIKKYGKQFFKKDAANKLFIRLLFFFLLAWLPILIVKYPGAMCWDAWGNLHGYRYHSFSSDASAFMSLVLGSLVGVSEKLGHPNLGLFAFVFVEYLLSSVAFSFSLSEINKLMKLSSVVVWLFAVLFVINPYVTGYVGVAIKDNLYSSFVLCFTTCLFSLEINRKQFFESIRWPILFICSAIFACLFRKSVIWGLVLFTFINFPIKGKGKKLFYISIIATVLSATCVSFVDYKTDARKGGINELLSIPFQQTARYARDYGDEVTEEEKVIIDRILNYDTLAERYDPSKSDMVKSSAYNIKWKDTQPYFKVWFHQLLRHPLCYLSATWEQNYSLFTPEVKNVALYRDPYIGYENGNEIDVRSMSNLAVVELVSKYPVLQQKLVAFFDKQSSVPVIGLIGNVAFYVLTFLIFASIAHINEIKWLIVSSPLWITILFAVSGPAILGHPRYLFPLIYCMPLFASYVLFSIAGEINEQYKK